MRVKSREFCIEVWGDFACFTNPLGGKVDRYSYDVITPSAAKNIIGCIFDKPAIDIVITKIEVLSPITRCSFTTNEISTAASLKNLNKIIAGDNRDQRRNNILKDVKYRIYFHQEFIPVEERGEQSRESGIDETPKKYEEMFIRRARRGQVFKNPFLGQRDYPAYYRFIENQESDTTSPINVTMDMGIMFYGYGSYDPSIANSTRMWFRPQMINGTIITDPEKIEIIK